jgi:cold shock CspA family protein
MQVQGEITKFRNDIGFGIIKSEDGRKYRFTKTEVVNSSDELVGATVDFFVVANRPTEIIVMQGSPWTVFGAAGRA